jgi:hypothetical protein
MIPQQPVRRLEISGGDGLRAGHHAPERPYRPGDRPDDEAGAEQRIGDHEHEIRNAVPDDAVGDFLHQRRVGIDSEHGDEASVRAQDRRVGRRVKPVQRIFHNIGARREAVPQPLQMLRVDIRFLVDRGRHVRIPRLSVDHDVCPAILIRAENIDIKRADLRPEPVQFVADRPVRFVFFGLIEEFFQLPDIETLDEMLTDMLAVGGDDADGRVLRVGRLQPDVTG